MNYKLLYIGFSLILVSVAILVISAFVTVWLNPKVMVYSIDKDNCAYYIEPDSGFDSYCECYNHKFDGRWMLHSEQELEDYVKRVADECGLDYKISMILGKAFIGKSNDIRVYLIFEYGAMISMRLSMMGAILFLLSAIYYMYKIYS